MARFSVAIAILFFQISLRVTYTDGHGISTWIDFGPPETLNGDGTYQEFDRVLSLCQLRDAEEVSGKFMWILHSGGEDNVPWQFPEGTSQWKMISHNQ